LAANVYGFATAEVLQRIVKHNPGIGDVNRILVGTAIRFPDVSDLQPTTPRPPLREQQKS
jgi:phage tail protein X